MRFNFDSPEPIYLQVAEQVEEAIFTGVYQAGEQVPSTTEVSKEFHINPATVLKGINQLVAAGMIEKRRGVGMFVTANAAEMIREKRRAQFYDRYVSRFTSEAKKLNLSEAEVIALIQRAYQD
ncbi:GntR family transcriptional regulator [Levilactobacillus zymae]|uniref:GntR family transcriptional regulator n=1 Tax=Levilactobacillus zymae TaxID=267363 RepID=A0A1Y6JTZ9_9LACO|nr:GntR family transcriptional regulator [Levilactobacillus zymae]KRL08692.1 transcriptional regulator [Levilactobacillus zymae DSM 19395]MDT6979838.1 GntR family transcriptional regulator [Levilactobacillus zymae]QFR61531.1 GntR family transcriptional regulator [Levilactobacillus zymae]SMS13419.1 Transcriptional regulator, GntR family [Levilactobacillus zymae]GEO72092.1 GntR family transcriptional regulator [Levilactobacillus zymae]